MTSLSSIQGSLRASLFVFVVAMFCAVFSVHVNAQDSDLAVNEAQRLGLAYQSTWKSLLHFSQDKPHISDSNFLLSHSNFSLDAELNATIDAFYGVRREQFVCRFPARYFWLKQYIPLPEISYKGCDGLIEFEKKAPIDTISVVYVSENISQPSSMMGHLFLKISGKASQSQTIEHAISFYTDSKTVNIPKLMYDSMIKGKKGYFALSPYAEKVRGYIQEEQRNLWLFDLHLNDAQRRLIQLHLYELKQTEFEYFFQRYNCATVISFIVSLAIPELREPDGIWITPLDVIKKINLLAGVQNTHMEPSNRWALKMLQEHLPSATVRKVKFAIEGDFALPDAETDEQGFLIAKMARDYNNFRFEGALINRDVWSTVNDKINAYDIDSDAHQINLDAYKNPLKTPPDSQIWVGIAEQESNSYLRTGILPASHSLEDDNREYFGETGLHLASLAFLTRLDSGKTQLEHFELYKAESLIPYDSLTGGISGRFSLGVEPIYNSKLQSQQQVFIKGALGYTYGLTPDIDIYALAGTGLARMKDSGYLFVNPEVGIVVREVFDMKSILSATVRRGLFPESSGIQEIGFTQAKYLNKSYALFFHANRALLADKQTSSYDLTLKNYF